MEYKYKKENHDFWVDRLKKNPKNQVCTNDVLLDKIETQQILNILKDDCFDIGGWMWKWFAVSRD